VLIFFLPNVFAKTATPGGLATVTVVVVVVVVVVAAAITRTAGLDAATGAAVIGWGWDCALVASGFVAGFGFTGGSGFVAGPGFVRFPALTFDESDAFEGVGVVVVGTPNPMFAAITAALIGLAATIAPAGDPAAGAASDEL